MRFAATVVRDLGPGDEIVCTRLDHDSNVRPWVIAAERAGATVRFAEPEPGTLELPASAVEAVLSERTRWVAVTAASNAVGTIPDLPGIVAAAHAAGARVYVDAVHATPHRRDDVDDARLRRARLLGLQVVRPAHRRCSAAGPSLLEELHPDKLQPVARRGPRTAGSSARCRSSRSPACAPRPSTCSTLDCDDAARPRGRAAGRRARRPRARWST